MVKRCLSVLLTLSLLLRIAAVPVGVSAEVICDTVYYDKNFDAYDNDLKLGASTHPAPKYEGDKVVVLSSDGTADKETPGLYPGNKEYQNLVAEWRVFVSSNTAKRLELSLWRNGQT